MRLLVIVSLSLCCLPAFGDTERSVKLTVMDPLAAPLACECVAGYAQRNYARLAAFIEQESGLPVVLHHAEALGQPADLVIGRFSVVIADAKRLGLPLRAVAMLSDPKGCIDQHGLFVVRAADPAVGIGDLGSRRLRFGPPESQEQHGAAMAALEAFGIARPKVVQTSQGCSSAALAVIEKEADCAIISSYAWPLLAGCGTLSKGELKVIGKTANVPFIGVFAMPTVAQKVVESLLVVKDHPELLKALESRDGFIALPAVFDSGKGWRDWRGNDRQASRVVLPAKLPTTPRLLWSHVMTGQAMAGVAAADNRVVVADKNAELDRDVFRCLNADTGQELWQIQDPAAGEMDFSNSARANPVLDGQRVYLLGAFGNLICADLASGNIVWRKSLAKDFKAKLPTWGFSATPLLVDDKLIVNPGAPAASLVALDKHTGKVIWQTPGELPGYASFILAAPNGVRQIIGYDAVSIGGWLPDSGKRLWRLTPPEPGDFNVPTPLMLEDRLLLSTENNGTRLYGFDRNGVIQPAAIATSEDLSPDTSSPVVCNGLVFGSMNQLVCLDAQDLGLKWRVTGDPFKDYCTFIAGDHRVLAMTQSGALLLLDADPKALKVISRQELFPGVAESERDVWSHPALVGNRLFIRNALAIYCFLLD